MKVKLIIRWPWFLTPRRSPEPLSSAAPARVAAPLFASVMEQSSDKERDEHWEHAAGSRRLAKVERAVEIKPGFLHRVFSWLRNNYSHAAKKQLRITESVSLGDKRFVAIVQVDGDKYLIGGGTSGVSLLTQLERPTDQVDAPLPIRELTERSA